MEEKYKKFLQYNWGNSEEWQSYYNNIFPTPPESRLNHYKKKFYKLKIDPDFDITYEHEPPQSQNPGRPPNMNRSEQSSTNRAASSGASANQNRNSSNTSSSSNTRPTGSSSSNGQAVNNNVDMIIYFETFLWLSFFLSIVIHFHTLKIACVALVIKVIQRAGSPSFTYEYAQIIFMNEHFQQVIYILIFIFDRTNLFILVPIGITAVMSVCDNLRRINHESLSIAMPYCNAITQNRTQLTSMRSHVEVAIGFLLFAGIIFGINSLLTPIFYWQYLRFKYLLNNDTKSSFSKLNQQMNAIKSQQNVPDAAKWVLSKLQDIGNYMGRTTEQGQGGLNQNCIIF